MAMNSDTITDTYFAYLQAKYTDYPTLDKADIKQLVNLILLELLNANITISITNPLGLVAGANPVTGTAPNCGTGSITG